MHKLDHIVFGARTLEEGTNFIEKKLDIKLSEVGYHDFMGTHNRVVKVDKDIYLEVIAIDPSSKFPNGNRWFNLDNPILQKKLEYSPQMIGYVIETKDKEILKHFCTPIQASRGNYKWNFAMPNLDSNFFNKELIENGIIPSLINWKSSKPITQMKDNQFSLNRVEIHIQDYQTQYQKLIDYMRIIEKLKFSIKNNVVNNNLNAYPIIKASIKDNNTNKNILI
tara:strand:+ start:25 stop:693 length:669 start_codon:yes stop_codon:yes gene_type:complete